jgi:uncharacterized protein YkwD
MTGMKAFTILWLLFASCMAFAPPTRGDSPPDAARVLELVNEARAKPRRCGWKRHAAVPPLARSAILERVAVAHARDMAARRRMSHSGADGSTPGERATRAGYHWRALGENVAFGQPTPEQVVAGWLDSTHHCANIMDPDFTEMGIGSATSDRAVLYWSQVFGKPAP